MIKLVLFISLAVLVCSAPSSKLGFRNLYKTPKLFPRHSSNLGITGGQEAEPHSIPHIAFLEIYDDRSGWYCGGTLISENYILTAGNCIFESVEVHATLGAHKPHEEEDTQVKIVSREIFSHEDFDMWKLEDDIGVVKLPEPIEFNDVIKKVALPTNASDNYAGKISKASGWGLTDSKDHKLSDVLNYVEVKVLSNPECEQFYGILGDQILCTAGDAEGKGICTSDSGGPLTVDDVLIGITSFGVGDCAPRYPSGFTRVTSYLDWISNHTDVVIG